MQGNAVAGPSRATDDSVDTDDTDDAYAPRNGCDEESDNDERAVVYRDSLADLQDLLEDIKSARADRRFTNARMKTLERYDKTIGKILRKQQKKYLDELAKPLLAARRLPLQLPPNPRFYFLTGERATTGFAVAVRYCRNAKRTTVGVNDALWNFDIVMVAQGVVRFPEALVSAAEIAAAETSSLAKYSAGPTFLGLLESTAAKDKHRHNLCMFVMWACLSLDLRSVPDNIDSARKEIHRLMEERAGASIRVGRGSQHATAYLNPFRLHTGPDGYSAMRVQLISLVGNAAVVSNSLPAHLSMRSTRGEPERAEFYVVQATWMLKRATEGRDLSQPEHGLVVMHIYRSLMYAEFEKDLATVPEEYKEFEHSVGPCDHNPPLAGDQHACPGYAGTAGQPGRDPHWVLCAAMHGSTYYRCKQCSLTVRALGVGGLEYVGFPSNLALVRDFQRRLRKEGVGQFYKDPAALQEALMAKGTKDAYTRQELQR